MLLETDLYRTWEEQKWRPFAGAIVAGDSGFPGQLPWICTPFGHRYDSGDASVDRRQRLFNKHFIKARGTVERTIGIIKERFRVLGGTIDLPSPVKVGKLIYVLCALHNFVRECGDVSDFPGEQGLPGPGPGTPAGDHPTVDNDDDVQFNLPDQYNDYTHNVLLNLYYPQN